MLLFLLLLVVIISGLLLPFAHVMGVLIVGIVVRVPAPSTAAATSASTAPRLLLRFRLLLLLHPLVLRPSVLEPYLHLQRSEIGFPSVRLQFYELQNKFNNRTTTLSQSKIARVSLTFHWFWNSIFRKLIVISTKRFWKRVTKHRITMRSTNLFFSRKRGEQKKREKREEVRQKLFEASKSRPKRE